MGHDFLQVFFSSSLTAVSLALFISKLEAIILQSVQSGSVSPVYLASPSRLCGMKHCGPLHMDRASDQKLEVNCPLLCSLNQASRFAPLQLHYLVLSESALVGSQTPGKLIS